MPGRFSCACKRKLNILLHGPACDKLEITENYLSASYYNRVVSMNVSRVFPYELFEGISNMFTAVSRVEGV